LFHSYIGSNYDGNQVAVSTGLIQYGLTEFDAAFLITQTLSAPFAEELHASVTAAYGVTTALAGGLQPAFGTFSAVDKSSRISLIPSLRHDWKRVESWR
jgi:hypothetical protein